MVVVAMALYFNGAFLVGTGGSNALAAENSSQLDLLQETQAPLEQHSNASDAIRKNMLANTGDAPLVRAYLGQIRQGKEWLTLDDLIDRNAQNAKLEEYRNQRIGLRDNDSEHEKLANWCRTHGLVEQEQAHLLRALDFNPDNETIRRRLGHVRGERSWLSREEADDKKIRERQMTAAKAQWLPKLEKMKRQLSSTNEGYREEAAQLLRVISDPGAISALEEVFAEEEKFASLLVETLARIDDPLATQALARAAVDQASASVRTSAMNELKNRDRYSFVPLLLSGLRGPIVFTTSLNQKGRHYVEYVQHLERAAQNHDEVLEKVVKARRVGEIDATTSANNLQQRVQQDEKTLAKEVARENAKIEKRNARIMAALEFTTGNKPTHSTAARNLRSVSLLGMKANQAVAPELVSWWNWWQQENEVSEERSRSVVTFHHTSAVVISDLSPHADPNKIPNSFESSSDFQSERLQQRCECFVAGTKVWTDCGPLAIERIRTGERVLTQNMKTGELEFKGVIRPTTRPTMQLVRVTIGSDVFTCTGGHFFWVVNTGWMKARDLKPGMIVHGAQGSAAVIANEIGSTAPTFNLVVADNHNYFVGESRLLSYDNSPLQPVAAIAPGVTAARK